MRHLFSKCGNICWLLMIGLVASTASASERRALLIGIDDYESETLPDLRGALNDVARVRHALETRHGFAPDHISELADAEATREGILSALRKFVKQVGPDDVAYIHYSGHGSQVQDLDGDEVSDGMDETIVPQDGRTEGVPDITDDELAVILGGLKCRYAMIVLDSCHSGTATRDVCLQARWVPPDDRIELYRTPSARGVVPLEERYILVTGAADNQSALDGPIEGTYYGLFSYALTTGLLEIRPGVSLKQFFAKVAGSFNEMGSRFGGIAMPEPQLEAPEDLLQEPLLLEVASPGKPEEATVKVKPYSEGQVLLLGGVQSNARLGSCWAVFPSETTEFVAGRALALAEVTGVVGDDAIARLIPHTVQLPRDGRAIPVASSTGALPITIRGEKIAPEQEAVLQHALAAYVPEVRWVGGDEYARFLIEQNGKLVSVYGMGGLQRIEQFSVDSPDDAAEQLAVVLLRSQNAAYLSGLENPASSLTLVVETALSVESESSNRGTEAMGDIRAYRFKENGELRSLANSLVLEVRSSEDCYITIVNVDAKGGVNVLFPNEYQNPGFYPEGRIPGKEVIRIPDSLTENEAGFYWDCGPPTGVETIQVIACRDLPTAQIVRTNFEQMAERGDLRRPGTRSAGSDPLRDPLQTLRVDLASRWLLRGFQSVPAGGGVSDDEAQSTSDWVTKSITVLVEQ